MFLQDQWKIGDWKSNKINWNMGNWVWVKQGMEPVSKKIRNKFAKTKLKLEHGEVDNGFIHPNLPLTHNMNSTIYIFEVIVS